MHNTCLRNTPGVATESFGFSSLDKQQKLMYQNGEIGIIPKEVRENLLGREFNSFDEFRAAIWEEIGNSSFANEFNSSNQALMKKGKAPKVAKHGIYKSNNTYALHHKQPIDKGGAVYDFDNLVIVSPRMHNHIIDPKYHYGKKGASLKGK